MKEKAAKTRQPSTALSQRFMRPSSSPRPTSLMTENIKDEIQFINVDKCIPFRGQARGNFNTQELEAMAQTMIEHGVRQPLTVIQASDSANTYEVVSGERRLRAAKIAGLLKVPCIIIFDVKKAEEISLIENIHRKDLHPIELGKAYARLIEKGLCSTQEEIAKKVSTTRSHVVEAMQFAELPEDVCDKVLKNELSTRAFLRVLVKCRRGDMMAFVDNEIAKMNGSGKRSESPSGQKKSEQKKINVIQISLSAGQLKVDHKGLVKCSKDTLGSLKTNLLSLIDNIDNAVAQME